MADILERRKKQLEGYSSEENTALREAATRAAQRQQLAQERALRGQQAASGVTGGLKLAQQRAFQTDALKARQEAEKNLFLQNIAERQRALGAYEGSLTGAEETETSRYGRRQAAKLATEMGYGQLAAAERGGATQAVVGEMQAASAANQGRGGGGKK
jgi:predicted transposase YdaD